ncbi:FAD:protein FMN transferase [Pusillimonas sp. ANT_WB101]|uniref:FAD:protein FMN transferase n=1 Tax=Pusillimonas sp. ANT_WB101 TaxID=2597356 RepID=UPI0011EFA397|nr:FAD:protein FMN transferase [Pusillimonas sp. ANT_WB101]KAA0888523.1 FAD:protein FMN transferase [Pusillimonas sp. ANT_WB101]
MKPLRPLRRRFIGIAATCTALGMVPGLTRRALAGAPETSSWKASEVSPDIVIWRGTGASADTTVWRGIALGADAELRIIHPDAAFAQDMVTRSIAELRRLEKTFSLYQHDSALSRLNRDGALNNADTDLLMLMNDAVHYAALTDGAFDPTVQTLWELYANHFTQHGTSSAGPSKEAVQQALQRVNVSAINVTDTQIQLQPGMKVTFNGIAQGYITDRVTDLLRNAGLDRALVDMGEIRGLNKNQNAPAWRAGLKDPQSPDKLLETVLLTNDALSTSGGYGTWLDDSGAHTHLFDPKTGESPRLYQSVSVLAPRATTADALSTAFSSMPVSQVEKVVKQLGIRAWLILPDGQILVKA